MGNDFSPNPYIDTVRLLVMQMWDTSPIVGSTDERVYGPRAARIVRAFIR